jgi:ElaB/YqjD/DUF883 family membrane-anchored ribosome-binding protein
MSDHEPRANELEFFCADARQQRTRTERRTTTQQKLYQAFALNLHARLILERFKATYGDPPMASIKAKTAQEMNDFHTLVADTERLLEHTKTLAGDQADELRAQIHDSLLRARETLKVTEDTLRERGQAAVTATEDYVSANPWQSVGIAAGVGFLIGLLATRR